MTSTRSNAAALYALNNALEDAFQLVQADIDAGPGGSGPLVFDYAAASVWVVNHNLGRAVSVEVLNAGGARIGAEVQQYSLNQVRVYFDAPVSGRVVVR